MANLFDPIVTGRRSTHIVSRIQTAIDEGELRSGDRLPPERDLAEQFQVSRVTVRDALRALEALGLLEIRVGASGGAFITVPNTQLIGQGIRNLMTMSEVSARDLAESRLAFELSVVGLAARRRDNDDIAALEALCDQLEVSLADGKTDISLSAGFHSTLARATKNSALSLISESFRGPLSMSAIRDVEPTIAAGDRTLHEHRELLEALKTREGCRAQDLMATHLLRGIVDPEEAVAIASEMRGSQSTLLP